MKNSISNLFFSQVRLKPVFFLASMLLIFLFSNEAAAQVKTPLNYTNTPQIASCANIPTSIELVKFDKDLTYFQSGGISILIKPTGVFEIDNQFILELSNQSGDFTNSTVLVTRTDFFLPALNGIIPATTTPGTAYKLRVRSTNPARELVTGPFSITNGVSGSKSPSLAYSSLAPSNLDEFIKCVDSENNFFGLINKDINDLTPGGGGSQRINFFLSDFDDQSSTTEVWFINEAGVEEILTISPAGQVSIPSNKPVGYYLISIRKKYGSKSLTSSFIFLYNTGNTGLANTSNENVCVDNAVNFVVDAPAMSKNYPGSLYSINHGDGSPTKYYTHARLMSCSALSNIYRKTSCSDTENRSINEDAYYFRTDLKLFNKGIFDGNVDQCNAFLENGQGTTKWINVSKSPIAQFDVPTQVCAGNSILADEYSLAGQWGDEFSCNTNFNVSWEVLYPGTTDYEEIQPNSSWITPSRDLLIPGTVTSSRPGCWKIRLSVSNPSGCTQATFIEKTVAVEKQPIPTFTLAPSSQVCKGAKIAFTNTSNTLTAPLECQTPTYQWIVTPVAGTGALANGYAFADNTTPASINPFIQFNEPGGYDVILKITNICGTRESPVRRIDVLGTPSVEFQPDELTVCTLDDNILSPGAGYDLDFSAEPQKPEFGTFPFAPGTYLWEVFDADGTTQTAASKFEFANSTTATSPLPTIRFKAFGTYKIKVTANTSCGSGNDIFTFTLKQEPKITNTDVLQTICSGDSTQEVNFTSNMAGSTFSWTVAPVIGLSGYIPSGSGPKIASTSITNSTTAPLELVYKVTATNNGCQSQEIPIKITVNPPPQVNTITNQTLCVGSSSVPITFSSANSGGTITYVWENNNPAIGLAASSSGNSTEIPSFTIASNDSNQAITATITVTPTFTKDAVSCTGNPKTFTITVNPKPEVANQTITTCSDSPLTGFVLGNDSDGPIAATYNVTALNLNNLTVSAGAAAVANGLNASALADDAFTNITSAPVDVIYTIVPVSAAGCLGNPFTVTVTVKPQIVINGEPHDYNGFGISCFGADDGYIELTPNGGKLSTDPAGYTFSWTGPNEFTSTAQNIYGLAPGTYTVTVGTGNCTQSKTFIVTEPSPIVIAETISNFKGFEISCFGASDGRIVLAITGGSSTYTYLWTGSNGGVIPAGMQTAANLTDVPAGTYTVNVTDSNGCEKIETYTLRQPAPMTLSEVVANRRNIFCYGEATGNIRLLGSGGVKEYTFTLTGTDFTGAAVSLNSGLTNANLYDFGNLKAGQYLISLQDLNGCVNSLTTIILTQPSAPLQITNLVLSDFNGFNISCFGDTNGSISHQVIGGTPFSGPAPYRYAWTGPNGFSSTSLNLSNLTSGTYTVTITDAANCALVKTYEITSPEPIEVDAVKQNVLCGGENNGNIFIRNITGGTGTYQFVWIKDGVGEIKRSLVPEDLRNISPGRYVLVVTDENFCEYREVFTITEPVPLVTTLVKKENNLCFGDAKGVIQINVAGGTAPYRYTWSGPGGYTSTNKDLTGLLSGTYDVLVTDKQLCTSRLSVTITEPAEIIVTPTLTMVSCHEGNDGSISMNVSGGIPPYVYTWSGPNGFSSSTRDLSNLEGGSYDLVITDNIGCRITRTFEITDPEPIVITPTISDFNGFEISCKGGSDGVISLQITGGNGGYKIFWEGPGGFRSNLQKIEELLPGIYEVTVADSKNCIAKASYELIAPDELLIIKEDIEITDVSCFDSRDGALKVTIKKASVGPYRYELSGITITGFPLLESVLSKNLSYQFTGIQAGSYTLRVSDANGCALSELSGLIVDQPDAALSYTIQKTDATCYRANNGSIRVTPAGGTAPYTIRWNNLSTSFTLQNLSPGTYTATITDAKGCTIAINTEIKEASIFDLKETVKNISCFGKNDGSIQLNIIGGKGPLTIQWAHGPQEPVLNNLGKGIYHVVITDASGCKIEREFVINEPQPLDLSATVNDALDCVDPNSGSILISPFGGTSPYTYNWSNGAKTQNLIGVAPGSYSLELVDAMGCRILRQFTVIRPLPLEVSVVRTSERVCNPRGLKSNFKAAVTGGIAPYTVTWNRGTVTNAGLTMDTQELGVFIVTVTDAYGCIQTKRIEVIETDPIVPEFDYSSASFDFTYENLVNFEVKFTNTSTGKDKEVIWDFGDGTVSSEWDPTYKYAKPGTYTITLSLKDVDGCVISFSREIVITDFFFEVPNVFTPNDDGINDHFYPKFLFIKDIHVLIMNKWGELLYESKDLEAKGWDGKYSKGDATVGNYVYRVKYTTLDGRVYDQSSVFYLRK